ncbi:hypothetical protein EDD86DRAFT_250382 [Gorgonomyces haynaldii]|nr:hypothetical protein EDD86DRAFT_250382 [Gorgonomyces haynaldii]
MFLNRLQSLFITETPKVDLSGLLPVRTLDEIMDTTEELPVESKELKNEILESFSQMYSPHIARAFIPFQKIQQSKLSAAHSGLYHTMLAMGILGYSPKISQELGSKFKARGNQFLRRMAMAALRTCVVLDPLIEDPAERQFRQQLLPNAMWLFSRYDIFLSIVLNQDSIMDMDIPAMYSEQDFRLDLQPNAYSRKTIIDCTDHYVVTPPVKTIAEIHHVLLCISLKISHIQRHFALSDPQYHLSEECLLRSLLDWKHVFDQLPEPLDLEPNAWFKMTEMAYHGLYISLLIPKINRDVTLGIETLMMEDCFHYSCVMLDIVYDFMFTKRVQFDRLPASAVYALVNGGMASILFIQSREPTKLERARFNLILIFKALQNQTASVQLTFLFLSLLRRKISSVDINPNWLDRHLEIPPPLMRLTLL